MQGKSSEPRRVSPQMSFSAAMPLTHKLNPKPALASKASRGQAPFLATNILGGMKRNRSLIPAMVTSKLPQGSLPGSLQERLVKI